MFWLYNILMFPAALIWVPWMLIRTRKRAEGVNWRERLGDYSGVKIPKDQPAVWIHAVSVGEVMAALPILRQVKALLPEHHVVLSVTTSSGHRTAREHAADAYDTLVYFPIDILRYQMGAMLRVRPDVVAVMETELWFNFFWSAQRLNVPTMLINGRISDRSFPRSMKVRFFYKALLANVDQCLMQTETDRERILALGAKNAEVYGNCKFDQAAEGLDVDPELWREMLGLDEHALIVDETTPASEPVHIDRQARRPVVVIGSTRSELEERLVSEALEGLDISVVWAPRHIERADQVAAQMVDSFGSCSRRSLAERGRYVLLDTYGELSKTYAVADVVIIGGGFDNLGGQNLLQPLAHGKPVLHGPHMQNFKEVTAAALKLGASRECADARELRAAVVELIGAPEVREKMGHAGRAFVEANEGASRRYAQAIADAANNPE